MNGAEDLAAQLLAGQACGQCGTVLECGQPCPGCGTLPPVTGPELAAALAAAPLAAAELEARRVIADGQAMLDAAVERIHEADRIRAVARLRLARDAAQQAFDAHKREQAKLYPPRTAARKAAEKAAAELEQARAEHDQIAREKEVAERYKHGLAAETEAALKLDAAAKVLRRYEQGAAQAAARRNAAEVAVTAAEAAATRLEAARDAARSALNDPGRIGYGAEAITAGLMRLLAAGQLDGPELLIAGTVASWVCAVTGITEGIEAQARAELLAEQASAHREKPLMRGFGQDGMPVAIPNPYNPATPQAFHPQTGPAHPVQPSTTPGWPG